MRENIIAALSLIIVGLLVSHYYRDRENARRIKREREKEYCSHYHELKAVISSNEDLFNIPDLENQILDLFNRYGHPDDMCTLFELLDKREKYLYSQLAKKTA